MHKYEAMFILRPDMNESERASMFGQIKETFEKFSGQINNADIWSEKRKLYFDITLKSKAIKFKDGLYYLVVFDAPPLEIKKISAAFRLNESILRFMITAKE